MEKTLIIGYGNPDRQDDGVAWHILYHLAARLGRPLPASPDEGFEPGGQSPDLLFCLQLTPELAETAAVYERVCFVDAHTGSVPNEINFTVVENRYQTSPFTHHMTPETLMALCSALYGHTPQAVLISVRGYQFGFTRQLSAGTGRLAVEACRLIWEWGGFTSR